MKKAKYKAPKNDGSRITERENFLDNRKQVLEEYKSCLESSKKEKLNIPSIIDGTNFEQFSIACVFRNIREQEDYTKDSKLAKVDYIDIKEEKAILKQMIKDAKAVFKTDYEILYNFFSKEEHDS